jgi:hypothetical protein
LEWREVLKNKRKSGQSGVAYCRDNGIGLKGFYRAKSKYGKQSGSSSFVKVAPPRQSFTSATGVWIELPHGRIELRHDVSARWVAELFKALSA